MDFPASYVSFRDVHGFSRLETFPPRVACFETRRSDEEWMNHGGVVPSPACDLDEGSHPPPRQPNDSPTRHGKAPKNPGLYNRLVGKDRRHQTVFFLRRCWKKIGDLKCSIRCFGFFLLKKTWEVIWKSGNILGNQPEHTNCSRGNSLQNLPIHFDIKFDPPQALSMG